MESEAASLYPVTFSVSKRPTPKERLKDTKPVLLFFLGCFVFGFLLPPLSIFLGSPLWFVTGSNFVGFILSMLLLGIVTGLAAIFGVRYISHALLGRSRNRLKELETRLLTGTTTDVLSDLDTMVTENLKLGRPQVAEFYSRQLLTFCEQQTDTGDVKLPEIMLSTPAWVSTPAYHQSINYFVIWLFQSRGLLCLTNEHLEYESCRLSFRVDLKDIVDIGIDRHPWWLKPYPLHFIKITFQEYGELQTLHLTPYNFEADTVWDINQIVKEWYGNLTKALGKVC